MSLIFQSFTFFRTVQQMELTVVTGFSHKAEKQTHILHLHTVTHCMSIFTFYEQKNS